MNNDELKIAIVVSQFNPDITEALREGAAAELLAQGVQQPNLSVFVVPGAMEIPITAQFLAKTQGYDAIIALGAVIRGETTHYDYVCQQVSHGCQQVALAQGIPVIFGVLTTDTDAQAWDRVGGRHGHKGVDAAKAALTMCHVLRTIVSI